MVNVIKVFIFLLALLTCPSLLLAFDELYDAPGLDPHGETNSSISEGSILTCEEEAAKNKLERYLMEADENEGDAEMRLYAEAMTQINIGTEDIENRLIDAQVRYPKSRHIQEALGWFYQRMYESSNDRNKLVKSVDAFLRAENFYFEDTVLKPYSKYADLISKSLILLNDREKLDDYFSEILHRHPSDTIAHLSYAKALSFLSDSRAELYFEKAIALKDEDYFQPTVDYVEHLLDRSDYEKALIVLNKEKSDAYYLHFLKGYTLEKLGKFKEAEEEYRSYFKFKENSFFRRGIL